MDTKARLHMNTGRAYAESLRRQFAPALFGLEFVEKPEIGAIGAYATDEKWNTYYSPERVLDEGVDDTGLGLLHEISHLLMDHFNRGRAMGLNLKDPAVRMRWNIAGDLEINSRMASEGLKLKRGVFPKDFNLPEGQVMEWYYHHLPGQSGKGKDNGQCGCGAEPSDEPQTPEQQVKDLLVRQRTAEAILQHAKEIGTEAGEWVEWAKAIVCPLPSPQSLLRHAIRGSLECVGNDDYSNSKLSHRYGEHKYITPGLRGRRPEVWYGIDTSGSMSAEDLGKGLHLLKAVLRTIDTEVRFIQVDTKIQSVKRIARVATDVEIKGRGGTDMRELFEYVRRQRRKPDIIILVSDCASPWPSEPFEIPTVVVRVGEYASAPSWVKCVDI